MLITKFGRRLQNFFTNSKMHNMSRQSEQARTLTMLTMILGKDKTPY